MLGLFYEDDLVTLYHGDCREELAWLDADVLVTDPPYGMRYPESSKKANKVGAIIGGDSTETRDAAIDMWSEQGVDKPRPIVWTLPDSPPRRYTACADLV